MNYFSHISNVNYWVTLTFLITFMTLFSCQDQDDIHKEFIVEGGITYLATVSGLKAKIGVNRLELNFNVVDPQTAAVGIYWNNYQDSIMLDVDPALERSVKHIIDLPEGQYSLFVKTFDKKGNMSNYAELITRTVGKTFKSAIAHRGIKSKVTSFNNDLLIEWNRPDNTNGARFTELIYTNIDNMQKTILVENITEETKINDYKHGTSFKRITYFSPDGQWLDTIVPPIKPDSVLMIDKMLGKVISFSSQDRTLVAKNFYNGKYGDMWKTNSNFPEYVIIDLGREVPVSGFNVWPSYLQTGSRADPRAPTKIKFETSTDNINWTTLIEVAYDNSLFYYEREFDVPVTYARFIRFTGVESLNSPIYSSDIGGSGNKFMCLAELDVFFHVGD